MLPELTNYLNKQLLKRKNRPTSTLLAAKTSLPLQDQRPSPCLHQLHPNPFLHSLKPSRWHRVPPVLPFVCCAPAHQATSGKNDRFKDPTSDLWSVLRDDLTHLVEPIHTPVQAKVSQFAVGGAGGDGTSSIPVTEGVYLQVIVSKGQRAGTSDPEVVSPLSRQRVGLNLNRGTLNLFEVLKNDAVDGIVSALGPRVAGAA